MHIKYANNRKSNLVSVVIKSDEMDNNGSGFKYVTLMCKLPLERHISAKLLIGLD